MEKNKKRKPKEDSFKRKESWKVLLREKLSGGHRWWAMPVPRKAG